MRFILFLHKMATSKDIVKADLSQKRKSNDNILLRDAKTKKARSTPLSLFDLCDATVRITKKLLALGADNNWDDVQHCQGRSLEAGKYRDHWLYLSRTDHGTSKEFVKKEKADWFRTFLDGTPQTFFYHTPKTESILHRSYVERNAAAAVLSLTGSCDQHAYVLATLLRAILPIGTSINICGLKMGDKPFPHTFVVIGSLRENSKVPLTALPTGSLLVLDAWTTVGGVVLLKDFFVCAGALQEGVLIVDKSYIADGQDHLIKRVSKQKILLDIIKNEDPDINVENGSNVSFCIHHDLLEQANYTQMIKRDRYLTQSPSDYLGMFCAPTISEKYTQSTKNLEAFSYICENYPHKQFKRCLEYVEEQVRKIISADENPKGDFTERLNSRCS